MKFESEIVEVSNREGNILITGYLDLVKKLFMVPCNSEATEEQRVQRMQIKGFAGVAEQRVETKYKEIMQLVALLAAQHTAVNTYSIEYVLVLISYLHATSGFPVI